MLSIAKGFSTDYLTKEVARGREAYYVNAVDAGTEPPGQWWGAGAADLGLVGEVDTAVLESVYSHLKDPRGGDLPMSRPNFRSAEQIHAQLLAAESGPVTPERREALWVEAQAAQRQAVSFLDCTFSAPKSVSVLGVAFERAASEARGRGDEAEAQAWEAHHRAVEEAVMVGARASIDYLQEVAGFSREGPADATRWISANRFVVAQFLQHDSRERDPQLHVHQAVLNGMQCADGKWRTLDGKAFYLHKPAAGAVGERAMEAYLAQVLGVRMETRPDGKAREVVGVSAQLMEMFSTRTRAITPKVEQLCREWERIHGHPPNALERSKIAQRVTLLTRPSKSHDGETIEQRLRRWDAQMRREVGDGLASVAATVLAARQDAGPVAEWDPQDVIARALDRVAHDEASWTRADLMRAVSDCLPGHLGLAPDDVRELLDTLTDVAVVEAVRLSPRPDLSDRPPAHLLDDGRDVYARPGSTRYAAHGQLAAERALREAAIERGAETVTADEVAALLEHYREHGVELGVDQGAAVRGILTDGAMLSLMTAPAGAGKTVVVGALAEAWRGHGRQVLGLAPSQVAADVMSDEGVPAVNIVRWLMGDPGVSRGDIVVVDEAGMASTQQLLAVHERCREVGAKLLLVGDPAQLGAVGPGGALPDLVERAQSYGLAEVRRFRNEWEGSASLGLRDGDPACLDAYEARGRIRDGGTEDQAVAAGLRAWLADTLEGRNALLLVGSNEAANQASAAARAELVRLGRVPEDGVALGRDGNVAGVGDLVQARRNGWHIGGTSVPINRATYRVTEAHADGSLTVRPIVGDALGAPTELPARYVAEHVALAYASTVHAAQGRTVDTAHAVLGSGSQLEQAYVALTRGRHGNTAWMVTRPTQQDSPPGQAQEVHERTGRAVLAGVLEGGERERSAIAEQDHLEAEANSEATIVGQLLDGVARSCAAQTGALLDHLAARGTITDDQRSELANDEAMSAVERLLRAAEVDGQDRAALLEQVLDGKSLAGARSVGQVLHHRLHHALDLDTTIASYRDLVPAQVRDYHRVWLHRRADDADRRRHELGTEVAQQQPAWAVAALGPVPDDVVERADWEQRAGWAAAYREMAGHDDEQDALGAAPPAGLAEKHAIWRTAHEHLGLEDRGPDEGRMSEGQLRARVRAWERERNWAPAAVRAQWAETSKAAEDRRVDGALRGAHQDPTALDAAAEGVVHHHNADQLDETDQVRRLWWTRTEKTRENADRSRAELQARGLDVDAPETATTAEDWLAEQRAAMEAEEQRQPIDAVAETTPDRAAVDEAAPVAQADEPVLETDVPDVRATAERHQSEDEPPERRPVTTQEAADAVARAQEALVELEQRDAYDAEHEWAVDDDYAADEAAEHVAAWT